MPSFMLSQAQKGGQLCSPTPSITGVPKHLKSSPSSQVNVSQTSCSPGKGVCQVTIPIQGQEAWQLPARTPSCLRRSCQLVSAANQRRFRAFLPKTLSQKQECELWFHYNHMKVGSGSQTTSKYMR